MYVVDQSAEEEHYLPGYLLMENAGRALFLAMVKHLAKDAQILIVVGPGNNGGDGFSLGRQFINAGYCVRLVQTVPDDKIKGDAYKHKQSYLSFAENIYGLEAIDRLLEEATVVIDAIFGLGFKGTPSDSFKTVMDKINQHDCVFSIDVPSGVSEEVAENIFAVKANKTFTIEAPKLTAYIEPTHRFYGEIFVVNIGLPADKINAVKREIWLKEAVSRTITKRSAYAHKGSEGHVLVAGGSKEMPGSVQLTAHSALRAGAGLVTLLSEQDTLAHLHNLPVEVMFKTREKNQPTDWSRYDAIVFGMGVVDSETNRKWLGEVLDQDVPVILDAGAFDMIASNLEQLRDRKAVTVITPHPKEMGKLVGKTISEVKRAPFETAVSFAKSYGVYVVLKGVFTLVVSPEGEVNINTTGNSGLSKGGTGDALAGIIATRMIQEKSVHAGISNAVYLHGYAADCAIRDGHTIYDLTATDVITAYKDAYRVFL